MVTHADVTQKFKMKPEIHISTFVHEMSKLLYMIATEFQLLYPCCWGD